MKKICFILCFCLTVSMLNVSTVSASEILNGNTRISEFEKATDDTNTAKNYESMFLYLTKYKNAVIKTNVVAPRYAQDNTKLYLTDKQGARFASKIETGYAENTIFTLLGFVPKIGPTITIAYWVFASYKSSVVSKIRKYTDRGKKVRINIASSLYGTFYGVSEWKGKTCPMVEVKAQNNGGKEKLLSIMLRK